MKLSSVIAALTLGASLPHVRADEVDHLYVKNDVLVLWVNNVGPYNNPQESYKYFSLPWCVPELTPAELADPSLERLPHIGEILHGVDHVYSRLPISFLHNEAKVVCTLTLDDFAAQQFDQAIRRQYWYQMHLDDLPVWGMVGEVVPEEKARAQTQRGALLGSETYLYTHKDFLISYNGPRIISVNMTAGSPQLVRPGATIDFSYAVEFVPTTEPFDQRFVRYLDSDFFQHQIHWFSILNAFMMVVFLCGVVAVIGIRTLKRDYAKYNLDASELGAFGVSAVDDSGWKQVHGDVFRSPPELMLLSVLLGNGVQLIVLFTLVTLVSLWGSFYQNRGATAKWSLILYAFTSVVSGFVSGRHYKLFRDKKRRPSGEDQWKVVMLLNATLLPALGLIMLIYLNCFAIWFSTLNVVPFTSLALIAALVVLVCVPLSAVGTFAARYYTVPVPVPCRVAPVPRPVEPRKWYFSRAMGIALSGSMPFGSIFIELYFAFSSMFNYKFYYVYGMLFIVFVILAMVTVCVAIVYTYIQLNFEEHRWHWISFACGSSVSLYVLAYSIYYYNFKTAMQGALQLAFFSSHMVAMCVCLAILGGAISYLASSLFVYKVYEGLKME